jgi:hypothetical protein
MRNTSMPVSPADSPPQTVGAGPNLALRLRTRARRARLDAELAAGTDPATSPEHRLRAAQLGSPDVRTQLANRLVEAVGEARRLGQELTSARRRRAREDVWGYADELVAVVPRLRDEARLPIQGLAITARLVDDRRGPLYRAGREDLGDVVRSMESTLSTPASEPDLRSAA